MSMFTFYLKTHFIFYVISILIHTTGWKGIITKKIKGSFRNFGKDWNIHEKQRIHC